MSISRKIYNMISFRHFFIFIILIAIGSQHSKIIDAYQEGKQEGKLLDRINRKINSIENKARSNYAELFYSDYWSLIESASERNKKPLYITIPAAKSNELTNSILNSNNNTFRDWHRSGGDLTSSRFSLLNQINKKNVHKLKPAWIYKSSHGKAVIQSSPVIAEGLLYTPIGENTIIAINASNGQEVWSYKSPYKYPARRGMIYYKGGGEFESRIIFPSGKNIVSLNALTGIPIANFGDKGIVRSEYISKIAPVISKGILINATFKPSIDAYNVLSGELLWSYNLIEPISRYFKGKKHEIEGGNPWAGMSLDDDRGLVFVSTGDPGGFDGSQRPGDNKNSNSIVAIDIASGEKIWSFQEVRHDLWDLDIASSPVLTAIKHKGRKIDVVATATKLGNIVLLDRVSGKPIFEFRLKRAPVSKHPGERTSSYQPSVQIPEPFSKQEFKLSDITNIDDKNHAYVLKKVKNAKLGFFPTPEIGKTIIFFGINGGVEWPGSAVDQKNGILYVASHDIAFELSFIKANFYDESRMDSTPGRIVYQYNCSKCHGDNREGGIGPSLLHVSKKISDEKIMKIILHGGKKMRPVKGLKENEVNSVIEYLNEIDSKISKGGFLDPIGYQMLHIYKPLTDKDGFPGNKPPWGVLNAINLNTGKILWKSPLGKFNILKNRNIEKTGRNGLGGPTVTQGGLVFIAGSTDNKVRAFDKDNGKELWNYTLPYIGSAPPATYEIDGKQFLAVPSTGMVYDFVKPSIYGIPVGGTIIGFSLPSD